MFIRCARLQSWKAIVAVFSVAFVAVQGALLADEITVKGTTLRGSVLSVTSSTVSFESEYGSGEIEIEVYNVLGQSVRRLYAGYRAAGQLRIAWDGRDAAGQPAASGLYLVSLRLGAERHVARMTLVR